MSGQSAEIQFLLAQQAATQELVARMANIIQTCRCHDTHHRGHDRTEAATQLDYNRSDVALIHSDVQVSPDERFAHIHPIIYRRAVDGELALHHFCALLSTQHLLAYNLPDSLRSDPDLFASVSTADPRVLPPNFKVFHVAWMVLIEIYTTGPANTWGVASLQALNAYLWWLSQAESKFDWLSLMSHFAQVVAPRLKNTNPVDFVKWIHSLALCEPHHILQPLRLDVAFYRVKASSDTHQVVCRGYQNGTCRITTCNRPHQCDKCLGFHPSEECPDNDGSNREELR